MQKFNGSLIRQFPSLTTGNAAAGVQVSVYISGTNTFATLYATNNTAGAQLSNPLPTDAKGFYAFFAVDGRYRLEYNNGFPALEIQLVDVIDINTEFNAAISGLQDTVNTLTITASFDFNAGGTVTARNQVVLWSTANGGDGREYRWAGALPKTVPPASTPVGTGGISDSAWVYTADVALEQKLIAGNVAVKNPSGSAALPGITFGDDDDTGLFRKSEDSLGLSTGGVERVNVTATGRVGVGNGTDTVAAQLHVQQSQLAIGILSRGFYEGSTAAPYVNNDVILCETYNRTVSDSANRSWAISCSNAYHDIPVGVTDSGTRVGCLGWAVSVTGRPGYEHRGVIGELSGVMGTSGFQGAGFSGAEITEATAVRGVVYADNVGGIIRFARAGLFASDGVDGGSTIEENAAVYARAQRGTVSNYSFYGELGELYNQNLIFSPEKISGGTKYNQTSAPITSRAAGNAFEFGFPDSTGYGSTLGATFSTGFPFAAFCAEVDAAGDTFTTRGKLGTVIYNNLAGGTIYGRLTNANAAGQSVVEDMRHRSDGRFSFEKALIMRNLPTYADNAAAISGGLVADDVYKTATGELRIVV